MLGLCDLISLSIIYDKEKKTLRIEWFESKEEYTPGKKITLNSLLSVLHELSRVLETAPLKFNALNAINRYAID